MNEPTDYNLTVQTPDKYFVEAGTDIPAHIKEQELVLPFKKKNLGNIIAEVFKRFHITETSKMLDRMKDLGYKHSTYAGMTVGIADIMVLHENKQSLMLPTNKLKQLLNNSVVV